MAAKFDPKAKAKRQKIILAVLGVVLVGVLAWQIPGLLKIMNKKPPAAATTAAPVAPAPETAVPGTPVSVVPSGTLVDSDPAAQAGGGQLISFDRFASKDPFLQQLGAPKASPASRPRAAAARGKAPASASSAQAAPAAPPPAAATGSPSIPLSARISVNGVAERVGVGDTFPADDPVFVLASVTKTTAKIGISGGTLDTGSQTVTLRKGKKLTLQNTADGAQYELVLISTA
jgi:hypothetical protein